ncbi:hypothetical protein LTR15_011386 [Elasticomyces elasticus]|nr:hypothetical protein LTR15_011386 [Elasticomyces elasticus]
MKYIDYEPDLKQRVFKYSGKDRSMWGIPGSGYCCSALVWLRYEVDGGGQAVHTGMAANFGTTVLTLYAFGCFVVQAMKEIVEDDEYRRYQDTIIDDDQCDLGVHQEFGSGSSSSSSNSSLPRRRRSANLVALLWEEDGKLENVRGEIEREWPALETGAPEDYFPVIEEEGVVFVGAPLPELGDEARGAGTGRALGEEPGYWERDD